jgi:hypothetical protein
VFLSRCDMLLQPLRAVNARMATELTTSFLNCFHDDSFLIVGFESGRLRHRAHDHAPTRWPGLVAIDRRARYGLLSVLAGLAGPTTSTALCSPVERLPGPCPCNGISLPRRLRGGTHQRQVAIHRRRRPARGPATESGLAACAGLR